jgi:hypothetical protein
MFLFTAASVKASRKITSFPAQSCAGARSSDYGKGDKSLFLNLLGINTMCTNFSFLLSN